MQKPSLCALVPLILLSLAASTASADVVTDWNVQTLETIRAERIPPPRASRLLALVHTAVYDAVNGIVGGFEPYHVPPGAAPDASPEAAAAAAAHTVLSAAVPARQATYDAALAASLEQIPDGAAQDNGVAWGEEVAAEILALRANDGSANVVPHPYPLGSGWWLPTPPGFLPTLLPNWPTVTPWALASGSQLRVPAPPPLTSEEYSRAFREVKRLGRVDSAFRTADQSEIALFWNDGGGTETPPGHWHSIARAVAAAESNSLAENARLFALLGITVADAAIVSWDVKYHYGHWRPVTGIREADKDGNEVTIADAEWSSFIVTPPFPAYTSGHSTFSGSSARLLAHFYGTDDIAFSATSDGLPGVTRQFTSFSQAAAEAGQSRIYGGIHWQYDNTYGLESGQALADEVYFNFLRPVIGPSVCQPSATQLCLNEGRFAVAATWRTLTGEVGEGQATAAGADSGLFTFFGPDNAELTVKVLNACQGFDRYWVFASGLTNVEVTLTVTDTEAGVRKTYFNPQQTAFEPVLDTDAFATCP